MLIPYMAFDVPIFGRSRTISWNPLRITATKTKNPPTQAYHLGTSRNILWRIRLNKTVEALVMLARVAAPYSRDPKIE